MGNLVKVYFDTNIWRELSREGKTGLRDRLKGYIKSKRLRILFSVLNFCEVCGLFLEEEHRQEAHKTACAILYLAHRQPIIDPYKLIEMDYNMPPDKRILKPIYDDSNKYLSSMGRMARAANPELFGQKEWDEAGKYYLRDHERDELFKRGSEEFIKLVLNDFGENKLKEVKKELGATTPEEFVADLENRHWLQKCVIAFMKAIGTDKNQKRDKPLFYYGLAGRLHKASAFLFYYQLRGRKPRDSDYKDLLHIILGGVTGIFVSNDERARKCFDYAWSDRRRVRSYALDEFIEWIRV